jgi:hypothetical protein
MKSDSMNFTKMVIAVIALVMSISTSALAHDGEKGDHKNNSELKFIGNMENQPVFELSLGNNIEDEYTVVFRDEYGNVLYNEKFKGAGLNKKFMLTSEELIDTALNVTVKSKNGTTEVYTINRSHSYVEETQVSKIK